MSRSAAGVRGLDGFGVAAGYHGAFPALRVAEEELDRVRADGDRLGERVGNVDVGSDARHEPSLLLQGGALPDEAAAGQADSQADEPGDDLRPR